MKRIATLFGLVALALSAQAQNTEHNNYIGVNIGGGLSSLAFSPADGNWNPRLGLLGELKYMHFFDSHYGFGLGAQIRCANSSATLGITETTPGLSHPHNGLTYTSVTAFNDWNERQSVTLLSIPVQFYWRNAMGGGRELKVGVGFQLDMPVNASYKAVDGTYEVQGYFPSTNVTYSNLPFDGFDTYEANSEGDIDNLHTLGVSLIADLGLDAPLNDNWSLYFGIYGGYGLNNMISEDKQDPIVNAPNDATVNPAANLANRYNGVLASNQVDAAHLFNVGVKVGIGLGWNCHRQPKANTADNKYELSNTPQEVVNNQPSEEELKAAEEARCNEQRMNDRDLAQAYANVDRDLDAAAKLAEESADAAALAALASAQTTAAQSKKAHEKGQFCKAYDLLLETNAWLAQSYEADANTFASQIEDDEATRAAQDAALYAAAARSGDLNLAMTSHRNCKAAAELAYSRLLASRKNNNDYNNAELANDLAAAAERIAGLAASKPAALDAKDAAGKAYMGKYADSYAAAAKSFYESTMAFDKKCNNAETKAAVAEARIASNESVTAARMTQPEEAYLKALKARECAERAGRACGKEDLNAMEITLVSDEAPLGREELQKKIDEINATVHFNFASVTPRFDSKTDEVITAICRALAADKTLRVIITGHTDNVGSAATNRKYGLKRAEQLKSLMIRRGAPARQIKCKTKGESQPEVPNDTKEHRAQNRRATIEYK